MANQRVQRKQEIAAFKESVASSELLGRFTTLLPEELEGDRETAAFLRKKTPAKFAKNAGLPEPTGPFANLTIRELVDEMLAREAGKPFQIAALQDISTSDVFAELRLRNAANAPDPVGTRTASQTAQGAANVLRTENAAANRDAESLITLGSRGLIDTPANPGNIGGSRRSRFLRGTRGGPIGTSTLVQQNNAIARAGGPSPAAVGAAQETGSTTPAGEALRRRNSAPIRLGSAPKDSGSVLGRAASNILARR